jgi:hypothetical protein
MSLTLAQEVEKILQYRAADSDPEEPTEGYYVKFKNRSYHHCEWVTLDWLTTHDARAKQRLQNFLNKGMVEPILPQYMQVCFCRFVKY